MVARPWTRTSFTSPSRTGTHAAISGKFGRSKETRRVRCMADWIAEIAIGHARSSPRSRRKWAGSRSARCSIGPVKTWRSTPRKHDVPAHPLYAKGYTSIGCGPCSRATEPGEDERAGRWWWETAWRKNAACTSCPMAEPCGQSTCSSVRSWIVRMQHKGFTLWFTGLSGAGKSTISERISTGYGQKAQSRTARRRRSSDAPVERAWLQQGRPRHNIRRIGFVSELLSRNGVIALVAAISPYREVREEVRGPDRKLH